MLADGITITCTDVDTGEDAAAIIRNCDSGIALTLSHKHGGDLEVVMDKVDGRRLIEALELALK